MKPPIYTIEELEKTFKRHATMAKKENEKALEEFKKNFPDEPIPSHFKDDFSFPTALSAMCTAILELRKSCDERHHT